VSVADQWQARFAALSVDRAHGGPAPHKPLLLLAVLDLIEDGSLTADWVELSPELIETFQAYWHSVTPGRSRGQIALPFFHLRSDGFWRLVPQDGQAERLQAARSVRSATELRGLVRGAKLDPALWRVTQDANARSRLRVALISSYFSHEQATAIAKTQAELRSIAEYRHELIERADGEFNVFAPVPLEQHEPVRSAGFRAAIMRLYDHTCAVCGLRLVTPHGATALEAAHIVPFAVSRNDDPRNGLGLCKLHHWCFDQGLISVSVDMSVIVSDALDVRRPTEDRVLQFSGKPLLLPRDRRLLPAKEAVRWHQVNVLQRAHRRP